MKPLHEYTELNLTKIKSFLLSFATTARVCCIFPVDKRRFHDLKQVVIAESNVSLFKEIGKAMKMLQKQRGGIF
jgi:hypothetical protein